LSVTVEQISSAQARYSRVCDRFKATWTVHQFASGAFRHLLGEGLPYELDLPSVYERVKTLAAMLHGTWPGGEEAVAPPFEEIETALGRSSQKLLDADHRLSASFLRRFFERMKRQDDTIVEFMIKFYLYAEAVEGDHRDKLDFLFTRLGEDYVPERDEYSPRESLELRQRIIALVSILRVGDAPRDEVVRVIRAIRSMREDIESATRFDDLTERNLLRDSRTFKHRVGDLYFDPDVLLAIIELNVAAKNRFLRLYGDEEERLVAEAEKLMEHGVAIERNFGDANPALVEEIARFREFKERFDALRAQSNVKHDVVARLKASMNNILAQLDRGLDLEEERPPDLPESFFDEARQLETLQNRFGRHEPLLPHLQRIASALDFLDPAMAPEDIAHLPCSRELRLEGWEAAAYQKLVERRPPDAEEDVEELWMLYLRAAALRLKVDEEATTLATAMAAGVRPEPELLNRAKRSLDTAKELDEQFGDFLQEAVFYPNRPILHQLYRSRFRLLRGFSGLWLIYDRQS
jgi:hypothetical protein